MMQMVGVNFKVKIKYILKFLINFFLINKTTDYL